MSSDDLKNLMETMYREDTAPWETGRPCSELRRRIDAGELPTSGKALDLGCGTGVATLMLAEAGFDCVGVDLSETAIKRAVKRAAEHPSGERTRFLAADLAEVRDIGEPFDLLVDRGCYHIIRRPNLAGYLNALEAFSRPGSLLFLLAFNADVPQEVPTVPMVSEADLRAELSPLFEFADLRSCRLDLPKGFEREPVFWSALLTRH